MYNLGYMYEFGVGVDRDLNLAKRNYDDALANSPNVGPHVSQSAITVYRCLLSSNEFVYVFCGFGRGSCCEVHSVLG